MTNKKQDRKFIDGKGREWLLDVNCFTLREVHKATAINLTAFPVDEATTKALSDPVTLCSVIWALVSEQAESQNISGRDFGTGMYGEALEAAADALFEAIVDFQPPDAQETLRKLLEVGREAQRASKARLNELLADPKFVESIISGTGETQTKA